LSRDRYQLHELQHLQERRTVAHDSFETWLSRECFFCIEFLVLAARSNDQGTRDFRWVYAKYRSQLMAILQTCKLQLSKGSPQCSSFRISFSFNPLADIRWAILQLDAVPLRSGSEISGRLDPRALDPSNPRQCVDVSLLISASFPTLPYSLRSVVRSE
jgi:hypothetical protein